MKKKFALSLFFLLLGAFLFAQSKKAIKTGDFMIGAQLSSAVALGNYNQQLGGAEVSGSLTNTFTFNILGEAGYFILDGLEIGPTIIFSYADYTNAGDPSLFTRTVQIGLGAQAGYFFEIGGTVVPFVEATINYLFTHQYAAGTITEYSGFTLTPEAGINLFVSDNIALEASLRFSYTNRIRVGSSPEQSSTSITIGLSLGMNVFF
jgi:hypothetical protein